MDGEKTGHRAGRGEASAEGETQGAGTNNGCEGLAESREQSTGADGGSEGRDDGAAAIRTEQFLVRKLVGRNVAALRTNQKLTKRRLSRMAGIGRHTLDKVEGGRNVTVNTLARVASALGVSLADLLDEDADADAGGPVA